MRSNGELMTVNPEKLNEFIGKCIGDVGSAIHGPAVLIGEQLGLYKALASGGPFTSQGLADQAGDSGALREGVARRPGRFGVRGGPMRARVAIG